VKEAHFIKLDFLWKTWLIQNLKCFGGIGQLYPVRDETDCLEYLNLKVLTFIGK